MVLLMASAQVSASDIPLAAPIPRLQAPAHRRKLPPPITAPAPSLPQGPEDVRERALLVGVKGGALFLTSGPLSLGGFGGVEVGYRLPFAHRFLGIGAELWAATGWGSLGTPLGREQASAFLLGVPLWLSANVSLGPGLLRVLVGPQFDYIDARLSLASVHDAQRGIGLAAACGAAYLFVLGPGALGLEARYSYLPYGAGSVTYDSHAFFVMLDYSFML